MTRNERMGFLVKRYGSALRASSIFEIDNGSLSVLVNGHRSPTKSEREKLLAAMGPYRYQKFFGKPRAKAAKIQGGTVAAENAERAVN